MKDSRGRWRMAVMMGFGLFGCGAMAASMRALNPIAPPGVFIADPEVRQMPDGRVYVYGSRDAPGQTWCSHSYNVLSSSDLVTWHLEQTSFASKGTGDQVPHSDRVLYAPDCIARDGNYYLFYCLAGGGKDDEGVAVGDSPYGPFRDGTVIKGISGIDPSVFIDDDGQAYLFWGQSHARGAKLSRDMRTIEGPIHDNLLTYKEHHFNEGSSVRKRNGIYYFVYGSHSQHGHSNCATLDYATATHPLGPYTYRGVIVDNWGSGRNLVNNHGCITEVNGQWYVAYHRPTHATSSMRKACLEPITFNPDGSINPVEMTTQGVGGPMSPTLRMDAARACLMSGNARIVAHYPAYGLPFETLADLRHGDTATWRYYDFDKAPVTRFTCKTYGSNRAARIELHLDSADGPLLGTCDLSPNDGGTAYALHHAPIGNVSGRHALVMVFKAADPEAEKAQNLLELEWFTFER